MGSRRNKGSTRWPGSPGALVVCLCVLALPLFASAVRADSPPAGFSPPNGAAHVGEVPVLPMTETIMGELLEAGVECPQFRLPPVPDGTSAKASTAAKPAAKPATASLPSDPTDPSLGEMVSLTGAVPRDLGNYELTGRWSRFSYCMQGRSFDVQTYRQTAPPPPPSAETGESQP